MITNSNNSYANLLKNFVYLDFSEEEAKKHWQNIEKKATEYSTILKREVNIAAVITDYFTKELPVLSDPFLVEENVFRFNQKMALIDPLTGLFNRRYMNDSLKKEYMRCKRYKSVFSICMMDIDNFKMINDKKGHQFGDLVLKNISQLFKDSAREEDIVCRYGGEEFLLILPATNCNGAKIFADRLNVKANSISFFKNEHITYSTGIATLDLSKTDSTTDIINRADAALYKAKMSGKNTVCIETF